MAWYVGKSLPHRRLQRGGDFKYPSPAEVPVEPGQLERISNPSNQAGPEPQATKDGKQGADGLAPGGVAGEKEDANSGKVKQPAAKCAVFGKREGLAGLGHLDGFR
jgi:hypothetical protein